MDALARYGTDAAIAATVVLACGWLAALLTPYSVHRQRIAELCIAVAAVAGLQAFTPLAWRTGPLVTGAQPAAGDASGSPSGRAPGGILVSETSVDAQVSPFTAEPGRPHPRGIRSATPFQPGGPHAPAWPGYLIFGSIMAVLYNAVGCIALRREIGRSRPAPAQLTAHASSLVGRRVEVRVGAGRMRPYCCGLRKAKIMVPASLLGRGAELRLRAVLLHEASHLRRRDPWSRAGAAAAAPLLYWNPLYWWLVRDSQRCAEILADDAAARRLGRRAYAAELLALAESTLPKAVQGTPFLPNPSDLLPRMNMLFQRNTSLPSRSTRRQRAARHSLAALLLGAVTLAWGRVPEPTPVDAQHQVAGPKDQRTQDAASSLQRPRETRGQVVAVSADSAGLIALLAELSNRSGTTLDRVRIRQARSAAQQTHVLEFEITGTAVLEQVRDGAESSGVSLQSFRSIPPVPKQPSPPAAIRFTGKNIDVLDLITQIASESGLNIIVSPRVHGSLTVAFAGISARQALESSVGALGYSVIEEGRGVLRVDTAPGAGK